MKDLISRQALNNTLTDWQMEYAEKGKDVERFETLGAVIDLVTDFPTIEPVKHGKWLKIEDCNTVQCSECFEDFDYVDGLCYLCHGQELPNYCPYCGAKMEGVEDATD